MRRHQILAALAGALLALPLQAAPGDIPEKRLFGSYDKYKAAPQSTTVAPTAAKTTTTGKSVSATPTGAEKTGGHTTKLSPGNERIARAIAKGALAEHGIKNPTEKQINTALSGGAVTTKSGKEVTMPGVLRMRAEGMGWGLIAQQHGFKLGEVMGRGHDKHHKHAVRHEHKHDVKHHGKPDLHRAKYERPEKFERPHKHERPERPERPGRGR